MVQVKSANLLCVCVCSVWAAAADGERAAADGRHHPCPAQEEDLRDHLPRLPRPRSQGIRLPTVIFVNLLLCLYF